MATKVTYKAGSEKAVIQVESQFGFYRYEIAVKDGYNINISGTHCSKSDDAIEKDAELFVSPISPTEILIGQA